MNWQIVFQLMLAVAGSSALTHGITSISQRRKVKAEATDVLTGSATELLETMQKRLSASERRQDEEARDNREFRKELSRTLREHEKWDRAVVRQLEATGISMDPPPELWV